MHSRPCSSCASRAAAEPSERGGFAEARARAAAIGSVRGPIELYYVLEPIVRGARVEMALVVLVDRWGRIERVKQIARGTRVQLWFPIGTALRLAARDDVRYFVLAHNHPSGDPWPSVDDANLTAEAEREALAHGFVMLDHLVLGAGSFFSFREGDQWTLTP